MCFDVPVRTEEPNTYVNSSNDRKRQPNIPSPSPPLTNKEPEPDEIRVTKPTHISFHKKTTASQNNEMYYDILLEVCEDDFDVDSGSDSDMEYNSESPVEFYGNRLLPIDSLTSQIKENLCCNSCHDNSRNEELYNFVDFLEKENLTKKCSNNDKEKIVSKFLENKVKESIKQLLLAEPTVGIATHLNIFCPNCEKVIQTDCERSIHEDKDLWRYNGNETYAINTMLVLGLQQIGGGGNNAMKLLTFLNLPNGKTIKDNKFK